MYYFSPKTEWREEISRPLVELGLELDPVEPERVEEGGEALHEAEDCHSEDGPEGEDHIDGDGPGIVVEPECNLEHHAPENLGQLCVGQGQGPETEVGGGVGHRAKDILDSVDPLVDHDLAETLLSVVIVIEEFNIVEAVVAPLPPGVHEVKRLAK